MTPAPRVSVLPRAGALASVPLAGRAVAVVDVLRATTVLPVALAAGATRILPAAGLEEARRMFRALPPGSGLLGGERNGKRVEGFDLGNSPLEYGAERVVGKTLIHASTNGSRALAGCGGARLVTAASLVNAGAAARRLLAGSDDVVLVACGNQGKPSAEDLAGCGLLVARVLELAPAAELDAVGRRALDLWRGWEGDVLGALGAVPHAVYLASLGFEADLAACAEVDALEVVPVMGENGLVGERG